MDAEVFTIFTLPWPAGGRGFAGRIGLSRLPGRDGPLEEALAAIRDWGATLVVSMTEMEEMARRGVADLGERLAAHGIDWRHFPIRDYGAPQAAESRWPPLSAELHAELEAGGSLLLHCAGGCGRSGMVALRLFVERGVDPAEALALIRSVRPCAVETAEQQAWATGSGQAFLRG